MHHYTYLTTDLVTFAFYAGVRSCECLPEEDTYMGSGKIISNAIKKHGRERFHKLILREFATRQEARDFEKEQVTQSFLALPGCMNLVEGGGGCIYSEQNPEYEKSRIEKMKAAISTQEGRQNRSNASKKSWADPNSRAKRLKALKSAVNTDRQKAKYSEAAKAWCKANPEKLKERAKKVAEYQRSDEGRQLRSIVSKKMWADEDFKKTVSKNMSAALRSPEVQMNRAFHFVRRYKYPYSVWPKENNIGE